MDTNQSSDTIASDAGRSTLESLVAKFESAWVSGGRPSIEEHLSQVGSDRESVLVELVHIDLEYRLKAGEQARVEEYLQRFPEFGHRRREVGALIAQEYELRRRREPRLSVEEYLARFPQYCDELAKLFGIGSASSVQISGDSTSISQDHATLPAAKSTVAEWPVVRGYEISGILGRGAMGVVYRAQQAGLKRTVALKMILAGIHADEEQLSRFRREAEAVAQLQHPNIVQIHEIGEHQGLPYFSQEYAVGGSLAHRLDGTPWQPRKAAALIEILARTMQAAHERGIIHRDLKPGNVLLACSHGVSGVQIGPDEESARYEPKIADFGLAKRVGGAETVSPTHTGAIIGTPSYMAPEQASGKTKETGPLVDVYALGAILYELLTGRPPFKGPTSFDTVLLVISEEVVPPRRLQPKLPNDLDTICLKCLQKEPAKRYENAIALAEDLRRFLSGEPIVARPVGSVEKLWRWCKRNRGIAASLAALFTVLLAGGVVSTWLAIVATRNANRADQQLVETQLQRERAAERFKMAREAVDKFDTQVSESEELKAEGLEKLRQKLLKSAVGFYERFVHEKADDPAIEAEQGQACLRLADIMLVTGDLKGAEEACQQTIAIAGRLRESRPDEAQPQDLLARARNELGLLYRQRGQFDQAEKEWEQTAALCENLCKTLPQNVEFSRKLSVCLTNLGSLRYEMRHLDAAEKAYLRSLELDKSLYAKSPKNKEYMQNVADSYMNLGLLYTSMGRLASAEDAFRHSLPLHQRMANEVPKDPDYQQRLARDFNNLGELYARAGRYAEAEQEFRRAVPINQRLVASHPLVFEYQRDLGNMFFNLGEVCLAIGCLDRAGAAYEQGRDMCSRLMKTHPGEDDSAVFLTGCLVGLGNRAADMSSLDGALDSYNQAVKILAPILQKQPDNAQARDILRNAFGSRACVVSRLGRQEDAEKDLSQMLQVAKGAISTEVRLFMALVRSKTSAHGQAVAEGLEVLKEKALPGRTYYDLACVYACAARSVRQDRRLPEAERNRQAEACSARAIQMLVQARMRNYFQFAAMRDRIAHDPDFELLRGNKDFNGFLASIAKHD